MSIKRLYAIDTLRGFAAIAVVFWHYQFFLKAQPFRHLFSPFYEDGQLAVDIFFVISGFVLSHVYGDTIKTIKTLRNFVAKRIARLYPLHFATFLATAWLFGFFDLQTGTYGFVFYKNDWYHVFLNLSLLQSVGLERGFSFNAPSWSISTEFWINVLFGAGLLVRFGRCGLIAAATALTMAWLILSHSQSWVTGPRLWDWIEIPLVRTVCGFYAGVTVHRLSQRVRAPEFAYVLMFLLGIVGAIALMRFPTTEGAAGAGVTLVCTPAIVYACAGSATLASLCSSPPGRWLGETSYSVYLWQFPVAAVYALIGFDKFVRDIDIAAVVYLLSVFAVAGLSYRCIEQPSRDWLGRKLRARQSEETPSFVAP